MKFTRCGLDIAKQVFQVHGVNEHGVVKGRKTLPRLKVLEFFAQLPPCLIGIEACAGAHYWARELTKFGHTVKLMAAQYVAAYRKRSKNDAPVTREERKDPNPTSDRRERIRRNERVGDARGLLRLRIRGRIRRLVHAAKISRANDARHHATAARMIASAASTLRSTSAASMRRTRTPYSRTSSEVRAASSPRCDS